MAPVSHSRFVLLDANLIAGYYLPESLTHVIAREHIKNIIESVKAGGASDVLLYIPQLCIPEVLSVFAKYSFATWDRQVKKNLRNKLTESDYTALVERFLVDIHKRRILNQVELNQYDILATRLISLVDAKYEYYRNRRDMKVKKKMMSAADHTIIGMGICLSRIHGRDNFAVLTADHRLADILKRATAVKLNTAKKLGLLETAQESGLEYNKDIYPHVINLAKTSKKELKEFFGEWPLPTKPIVRKPLLKLSDEDGQFLVQLRQQSGKGRDSLPYTDAFESICRKFEQWKGQVVDRNTAWLAIGRIEKRGKRKSTKHSTHSKQRAFF